MKVKYPEYKELKKVPAFDWLAQTDMKTPEPTQIIRIDMFNKRRNLCLSNDMRKTILQMVKEHEKKDLSNITINAELQKVFGKNKETKKWETYYILVVTIDRNTKKKQKIKLEAHNVKGSGQLYQLFRKYMNTELAKILLK